MWGQFEFRLWASSPRPKRHPSCVKKGYQPPAPASVGSLSNSLTKVKGMIQPTRGSGPINMNSLFLFNKTQQLTQKTQGNDTEITCIKVIHSLLKTIHQKNFPKVCFPTMVHEAIWKFLSVPLASSIQNNTGFMDRGSVAAAEARPNLFLFSQAGSVAGSPTVLHQQGLGLQPRLSHLLVPTRPPVPIFSVCSSTALLRAPEGHPGEGSLCQL